MTTQHSAALDIGELENHILSTMDTYDVPGLCIAIVKDGATVLSKGYGTCEIGKDLPVNEHTLFAISGTTASFTAAALALLVAENTLQWTDRLIDVLPGFNTGSDYVTLHATVIDALANRSGLPAEELSFAPHPDLKRTDILAMMKHLTSPGTFRSQWGLSFHMTVAAGEIIPALTGISWDDFVQTRLFDPIGMKDSVTGPHLLATARSVATAHELVNGALTATEHGQTYAVGPATSIYSSAADMAKWLHLQLNNGKLGNKPLIREEDINTIRSSHMAANFAFPGISKHFLNQGLGLYISDSSSGHKLYSNGGDSAGMESYHAFLPELNLGVAIMSNSTEVIPQPLIAWIIDRFTNAPEVDWVPHFHFDSNLALEAAQAHRQSITNATKAPSQPMASYQGHYHHPLLGRLQVEAVGSNLLFTLGTTYKGKLLHANNDTFYVKTDTPVLGQFLLSGPAQFRLDHSGDVSSVFILSKEFVRT